MMKRSRVLELTVTACLGVAVILIISSTSSQAQVTQGKSRPLSTKQLMKGLVSVQCGALAKGLKAGPADDDAWSAVAMQAALLNEASHTLMADGRCPDATWLDAASKTLRNGSEDLLKAIDDKDIDEANIAFKAMTKACAACHRAHKK